MEVSKNQNNSLECDAETLVRTLRQDVLKSCAETGRMPTTFIHCGERIKLEHDATVWKLRKASIFSRTTAALKYQYAAFSSAIGTLFDPYNLELLFKQCQSLGWGPSIMHFLTRSGFSFLFNGGMSALITEIIEDYWKNFSTASTSLSENIHNAGIGCIFGAIFSVVVQAVLYVYHHSKEKNLKEKLKTTHDVNIEQAIQERIHSDRLNKNYILSWRNVIKHVFSLLLGGFAAAILADGWPLLLAAIFIPWIIWIAEKLWDHFNGTNPIGFLTRFSAWFWGQTIFERQVESWVHQNENNVLPNIPDIFMCPITHEMMVHPVINNHGRIYERQAFETWLIRNNRDPETNLDVSLDSLRPLPELEQYIREYAHQNGFILHRETNRTII